MEEIRSSPFLKHSIPDFAQSSLLNVTYHSKGSSNLLYQRACFAFSISILSTFSGLLKEKELLPKNLFFRNKIECDQNQH